MREDSRVAVREVKECRWIEECWAVPDGDGVIIHSISGGVEFRARCSWHQFIKYHMASKASIAEHMARRNIVQIGNCECCDTQKAANG